MKIHCEEAAHRSVIAQWDGKSLHACLQQWKILHHHPQGRLSSFFHTFYPSLKQEEHAVFSARMPMKIQASKTLLRLCVSVVSMGQHRKGSLLPEVKMRLALQCWCEKRNLTTAVTTHTHTGIHTHTHTHQIPPTSSEKEIPSKILFNYMTEFQIKQAGKHCGNGRWICKGILKYISWNSDKAHRPHTHVHTHTHTNVSPRTRTHRKSGWNNLSFWFPFCSGRTLFWFWFT